jgi:hypothetical protein
MSVIDDFRKVSQDFMAPELRAISAQLAAIDSRLNAQGQLAEARYDEVLARIGSLKASFELNKRLEKLETRESRA